MSTTVSLYCQHNGRVQGFDTVLRQTVTDRTGTYSSLRNLTAAGEAYEPVWQTTAVNNGVAAKTVNYPIEQIMISLIGAAIKALCRSKPRDFAT